VTVLHAPTEDALRLRLLGMQRNHSARLCPHGRNVAFLRTANDGPEVWLHTGAAERRLVAHPGETVADLRWTTDGGAVVYRRAEHGREAWRLSAVPLPGPDPVLIPAAGPVTDYWLGTSDPTAVVYACRVKGERLAQLFRASLADPGSAPVALPANPGVHRWLVDGDLRPRGGIVLAADGSAEVRLGDDPATARPVMSVDAASLPDFAVLRFSRDGSRLFVISSTGAATRRLVALTVDGPPVTVFEHPDLDLDSYPVAPDGVWFDPVSGEPDICSVMDQRLRYHFLTPGPPAAVAHVTATDEGSRLIVDRAADDRSWLIAEVHDRGPLRQYLYDTATGRTDHLMVNRPELLGVRLPGLENFCFEAGDGRPITGYAMRPLDPAPPYPTVVLVHGGPAGRDTWRFHAEAQYLASLGCLSLHVNYRGSRGFGTEFRQAGNGEWGGLMQQDLYDAVAHGVTTGLVDRRRVVFMGASYGGYAALLAACTRPDLVRGAIAISPPCDLVSFATTPPTYWRALAASLMRQILRRPDGRTIDRATLEDRSPAHALDSSCAPVLIAHGARDPRVPVRDVDAFVERATGLGNAVTYLRFTDEGHHVKSDRNREILFGEIKTFLERHNAGDR
jgi:dipeptidyl aminopeptidase/acylaminoacyl peptidase